MNTMKYRVDFDYVGADYIDLNEIDDYNQLLAMIRIILQSDDDDRCKFCRKIKSDDYSQLLTMFSADQNQQYVLQYCCFRSAQCFYIEINPKFADRASQLIAIDMKITCWLLITNS